MYATFRGNDWSMKPWGIENPAAKARRLDDRPRDVGEGTS